MCLPSESNPMLFTIVHSVHRAHTCVRILQGAVRLNSLLNRGLPSRNQLLPCTSSSPTLLHLLSIQPNRNSGASYIYVCIMPNHLHIWLSFSSIWVVVPGKPEKGEMDFRMHRHPSLCPLSHLWSTYTTLLRLFPTPVHTIQYVM